MYLQHFGDEHCIRDSLSLRTHYSRERPDSLSSMPPMPPVLTPVSKFNQRLQGRSRDLATPLFCALWRRTTARQVSVVYPRSGRWHSQRGPRFFWPLPYSQVVRSHTPLLVETSPSFPPGPSRQHQSLNHCSLRCGESASSDRSGHSIQRRPSCSRVYRQNSQS